MNEVLTDPIAQATEEVTDVTENVESIDAPRATEFDVLEEAVPALTPETRQSLVALPNRS